MAREINFVIGTLDAALASSDSTFDFTISKQMQKDDGTYYDLTDDKTASLITQFDVEIEDKDTTKVELLRVNGLASNGTTSDGRPKYTATVETNGATKLRGLANTYDGTNGTDNVISANTITTFAKNSKVKVVVNRGSFQKLEDEFVAGASADTTIVANGAVNASFMVYVDSSGTATEGVDSGKFYGVSTTTVADTETCNITLPGNVAASITVPGSDGDYIYATAAGALTATAGSNTLVGVRKSSSSMLVLQPSSTSTISQANAEDATDTTAGLVTGQRLAQSLAANTDASVIMPMPVVSHDGNTTVTVNDDTTALFYACYIPCTIDVNKITFNVSSHTAAGTFDIALYKTDGQTQVFTVTTASVASTGHVTTSLGAETTVYPGVYYFGIVSNTAAVNMNLSCWQDTFAGGFDDGAAGEDVLTGTKTVTAGTLPATIDPTSDITAATNKAVAFRLDN